MKNFEGVIIEESLDKKGVLAKVRILETKVEGVTPEHHTPHLKQWTLHTVAVPENKADVITATIDKNGDIVLKRKE